jgi:hypothetical protein
MGINQHKRRVTNKKLSYKQKRPVMQGVFVYMIRADYLRIPPFT